MSLMKLLVRRVVDSFENETSEMNDTLHNYRIEQAIDRDINNDLLFRIDNLETRIDTQSETINHLLDTIAILEGAQAAPAEAYQGGCMGDSAVHDEPIAWPFPNDFGNTDFRTLDYFIDGEPAKLCECK